MSMPTMAPCYESTTKRYRHEMGGSPDAASLPKPSDESINKWGSAETKFKELKAQIDDALRKAEAAHEGRAADAANASIEEIKPHVDHAEQTCRGVKTSLEDQVTDQANTFKALPSSGESLENGREVQIDPPQKGWVEDWGLDDNPITGWMSGYEDKQEDFRSTNERAQRVMDAYQGQTDTNLGGLPQFKEEKPPEPPPPPPPSNNTNTANDAMGDSGYSSTPSMSGGGPAGSSSSWASSPSGGTPGAPAPSPTPGPPAGSGSSWAPGGGGLPPGTVRGPDGTLYRQNPSGGWERQNAYNGRWAPSPGGGPGGAGGAGSAGARGGVSGGAGAGGAGSAGAKSLGAGGRAGAGSFGPSGSGGAAGASGGAGGSGSGGGRGGAPMGGGGGARGGQGGEEEEHDRPSWLVETDDVFTNDMQRVAPPVLGENPGGQ